MARELIKIVCEEIGTVSEAGFSLGRGLLKVKSNELCRSPAHGPEIEGHVLMNFGVVPYCRHES